jgi:hypothetical protein
MNNLWLIRKTITGSILMITGILLTNINMGFPILQEITPADPMMPKLFMGITLIIIGFTIFTKPLNKMPKRHTKKIQRKAAHELLEVFGF